MRKQTKIAAVVSAAALLALGASITSFAASKGTWMMVDGEWYCYDKNGDAYTNTFCSSNGKEYYVGDDGQLVRSEWVEDGSDKYFVNSSGAKITNDWRLTTPYDDDSADEEWYYFQSNGKMATSKKITYKSKTYYFDSEGKMLTGWVTTDGTDNVDEADTFKKDNTFYCDETGARVEGAWVKDTEPGTSDDDADADEYWYYLKKTTGKAATGKQANVNGQIYLFDSKGRMLYGWVVDTSTGSNANFEQINLDDDNHVKTSISNYPDADVYYCGDEDDGHAKKNKWAKTWLPDDENEEVDDQEWFWFDKNGKLYRTSTTASASNAVAYEFKDGVVKAKEKNNDVKPAVKVSKKKVNSKDYWFDDQGVMLSKFYLIKDKMFYFGGSDDGSMKTGSQAIKDDAGDTYKFYFETKGDNKGAGITGTQNSKLYYYGMLIQADDYKYQLATINDGVNDHVFIVNTNGSIQHSKNTQYKEDGDALITTKSNIKFASAGTYKYEILTDENTYELNPNLTGINLDDFVVIRKPSNYYN